MAPYLKFCDKASALKFVAGQCSDDDPEIAQLALHTPGRESTGLACTGSYPSHGYGNL
jgi:hypothetical protein